MAKSNREVLARNILKYRAALDLNQAELARLVGVSQKTISMLEHAKARHNPTLALLDSIAEALKIDTYRLLQ